MAAIFAKIEHSSHTEPIEDSKVSGANMGPTWVLLAPDGPHVGPVNFAIWAILPLKGKLLVVYS